MPHILGAGVWQEALTFSLVISCFCVSFLVVLLAATCLIFAVRLGIVTWRHCKRLEAAETLDASGTVAWDLWHVVADIFKWKKNWASSICWSFPPVLMALCSVISSLSIPNEDGLSANLSCPYVPSDWLVTSPPPQVCIHLHSFWVWISAGEGPSAEQPCAHSRFAQRVVNILSFRFSFSWSAALSCPWQADNCHSFGHSVLWADLWAATASFSASLDHDGSRYYSSRDTSWRCQL